MKKLVTFTLTLLAIILMCAPVKADFYDDKDFDGNDLVTFIAAYGSTTGSPDYNSDCDFIDDGDVDKVDLGGFASFFGRININPPEAIDEVGQVGGEIGVTDPESPLYGMKVEVPGGTVDNVTIFHISTIEGDIALLELNAAIGKGFRIESSSDLNGYVTITCPLNEQVTENDAILVSYFEEEQNKWGTLPILSLNYEEMTMAFGTIHFTDFFIFIDNDDYPPEADSLFQIDRDRFNAANDRPTLEKYGVCQEGGICLGKCTGFAQFSAWYYLNEFKNSETDVSGLKCLWNEESAVLAAAEAHKFTDDKSDNIIYDLLGIIDLAPHSASVKNLLMKTISNGQPEVLRIAHADFSPGSHPSHSIVVYRYERINDDEINFYCYDPNYPTAVSLLKCNRNIAGGWGFNYEDYHIFYPQYLGDKFFSELNNVKDNHPADNWCEKLPGHVTVNNVGYRWTSTPQLITAISIDAERIYCTIRITTDGSTPEDPPEPTIESHDPVDDLGSEYIPGDAGPFVLWGEANHVKNIKVRFRGYNNNGYGPTSPTYLYQIDLSGINPTISQFPLSVSPGLDLTRRGFGFSPWDWSTVHTMKSDGNFYSTHYQWIWNDGSFDIEYTVPGSTPLGTYTMWVIDDTTGKMSNNITYSISNEGSEPTSIELPRTGQNVSVLAGDDGDIRAGVAWPNPRFTNNNDGTITDALTGLMWTEIANLSNSTWRAALNYISEMNQGIRDNYGYTDWRLANIIELESLMDSGQHSPVLPSGHPFSGIGQGVEGVYWSSTTDSGNSHTAFVANFVNGNIASGHHKTNMYSIWPVRSNSNGIVQLPKTGQGKCYDIGPIIPCEIGSSQDGYLQVGNPWPEQRFTNNGNGTITDNLTELMWTRHANPPGEGTPEPEDFDLTWEQAMNYISEMNQGIRENYGYTDWRLANRKELLSLIDFQNDFPALPSGHPFIHVGDYYHSSTTCANDNSKAWILDMFRGGIIGTLNEGHVLPVRNATE